MGKSSAKYEIIHEIVSREDNLQNIRELCAIAGVSRSGYYNWLATANKRAEKEAADRAGFELILKTECINRQKIATFEDARSFIDDYIFFYNHQRIQTKTKLTPLELRCQFVA